jgi:hypothetical protein
MSTGDDLDDDNMNTDVLPTSLGFRDCELVHARACVDWEAKAMGDLEELLARFYSCSIHISSIVSHLSSNQLS